MKVEQISSLEFKITLDNNESRTLDETVKLFQHLRPNAVAMALSNRFVSTLKKFKNMIAE